MNEIVYPTSFLLLLQPMNLEGAIVMRSTGSWYLIRTKDGEEVEARIKGKFRIQGIKTTNPVAVGDLVDFTMEEDDTAVITTIQPRKNYIIRKSVNLSKQAQIIASNIDRALLVVTVSNPVTHTGFIDRFLITAEAYHIPVTIVFNKIDIYSDEDQELLDDMIIAYSKIGYTCMEVSAETGAGVEEIKKLLANKTSMLSGHSGAGKSTLINKIDGGLELKTGDISESHFKGKHTTTFAEMFKLSFGGFIIDTPGIKGLGIVDIDKEEMSHYFLEMRALLPECKFHNCQHLQEPSCAIKQAVKKGNVEEFRYKNYLSMYHGDDEHYRTPDY